MDQGVPMDPSSSSSDKSYAFTGKIMLSAVVILFTVVLIMVCIHLYARWYVIRLRRRRRRNPTVLYLDHHNNHTTSVITDRGLDTSVLNSLPIFRYPSKDTLTDVTVTAGECAVCLSEFEENDVVRFLPKCRHTFHVDCIGMWFHSHSTCPICRSSVEAVVNLSDVPTPESTIEEGGVINNSRSEGEGSSSTEIELCATCQHEGGKMKTTSSLWGRRKSIGGGMLGIRIEVPTELENNNGSELTTIHGSTPGSRLHSLKRLFSMNKRTPTGSGAGAGSSVAGGELDLEAGGTGRVETPRVGGS